MYNKLNLDVGKIASKVTFKSELASVAFYGDKTVATDSFRLLEVSSPEEFKLETDKLETPILLNAKKLKKMKVSKDDIYDIERIKTLSESTPIDSNFPKYEELMTPVLAREDDIKVKINGILLKELLEIASKTNKFSQVELSIPQVKGLPILITSEGKSQKVRGLIMPMNR